MNQASGIQATILGNDSTHLGGALFARNYDLWPAGKRHYEILAEIFASPMKEDYNSVANDCKISLKISSAESREGEKQKQRERERKGGAKTIIFSE